MLLTYVQRWPNEQINVAPTIVVAVAPTLCQRCASWHMVG